MKKALCLLLALMALCFAGCGSEEPEAKAFCFSYQDTEIAMKAPAEPVTAALGEPRSYTETASCAFEGLDKTYFYGSFYMTTYPENGNDFVYRVWFADDSAATDEGIHIGSTRAEVEAAYGAENFNSANACVLIRGESKLIIALDGDAVRSVQYEAIFE